MVSFYYHVEENKLIIHHKDVNLLLSCLGKKPFNAMLRAINAVTALKYFF
jgi:hypothetical protein